jgi:hypothetical protein
MSTEAGRPARHPLSSQNAALAALCLGALILNVDTTIVTVALPDLVRQTAESVLIPEGLWSRPIGIVRWKRAVNTGAVSFTCLSLDRDAAEVARAEPVDTYLSGDRY